MAKTWTIYVNESVAGNRAVCAALFSVLRSTFADAKQAGDFVVKSRRSLVFDPAQQKFDVGAAS